VQKGEWFDANNCSTTCEKPTEIPERKCGKTSWLILITVLAAIAAALLVARKAMMKPKKKVEEKEKKKEMKKKKEENKGKYEQLIDYIRKARARGMSDTEIRGKLVEAKWPSPLIEEALKIS